MWNYGWRWYQKSHAIELEGADTASALHTKETMDGVYSNWDTTIEDLSRTLELKLTKTMRKKRKLPFDPLTSFLRRLFILATTWHMLHGITWRKSGNHSLRQRSNSYYFTCFIWSFMPILMLFYVHTTLNYGCIILGPKLQKRCCFLQRFAIGIFFFRVSNLWNG